MLIPTLTQTLNRRLFANFFKVAAAFQSESFEVGDGVAKSDHAGLLRSGNPAHQPPDEKRIGDMQQ